MTVYFPNFGNSNLTADTMDFDDMNSVADRIGSVLGSSRTVTLPGYRQLNNGGKKVTGRKKPYTKKTLQIAAAQHLRRIDRFQALTGVELIGGVAKFPLAWQLGSVATENLHPVYLFDLTSLYANLNNTVTTYAHPFYRLKQNITTGDYGWVPQRSYRAAGTIGSAPSDTRWDYERVPYLNPAIAANLPYEKAFLEWADIRLQAVGAKALPSSMEVKLVQFYNEDIALPSTVDNGTTKSELDPVQTGTSLIRSNRFWQTQLDNKISSNILVVGQNEDSRGMRVIPGSRKSFKFNPTATYENDANGHQITYKLFHRFENTFDYRWTEESDPVADIPAKWANVNQWRQEQVAASNYPLVQDTTKRIYLMISGFSAAAAADLSVDNYVASADKAASFDLCVRRAMTII